MSIGNYLTALNEQRDQLARNLLTMGVQASETEKLNTLVPKVLQIPQTKPDITLFKASIDALHDYGEKVYTFYNDGYRSLAGFTESGISQPCFSDLQLGLFSKLNLSDGAEFWANKIIEIYGKKETDKQKILDAFDKQGYSTEKCISKLLSIYKID